MDKRCIYYPFCEGVVIDFYCDWCEKDIISECTLHHEGKDWKEQCCSKGEHYDPDWTGSCIWCGDDWLD